MSNKSLADLIKERLEQKESEGKKEKKIPESKIDTKIDDTTKIDTKIDALVNERIIKLVKIGLKHELTIETMKQYFREVNKSKLYELKRYFSDSQLSEISNMLQYLFKQGILTRDVNNWYSLDKQMYDNKKEDTKNGL